MDDTKLYIHFKTYNRERRKSFIDNVEILEKIFLDHFDSLDEPSGKHYKLYLMNMLQNLFLFHLASVFQKINYNKL